MSEATPRAVFLSYASQDGEAVRRIAEALRAAGVEVWFDLDELRGGDEWDRKIKKQIRECALFVPVISVNTQARSEGYFRLEWHLAEQRSLLIAKGRPFMVPVCIDETREGEALVPDAFLAVQWTRFKGDGATATSNFAGRVKTLLAGGVAQASSPASRSGAGGTPALPAIPDYELLRKIGAGSYGDVWLARGLTGAYRAVKIVWRERFADAAPFEREFRGLKEFTAMSSEANQLALLHVGQDERAGFFYYVMELADDAESGRTFNPARYVPLTAKELKARRGRLPAAECVTFGVELARSLAGLHTRGLLHRDIKPSNVILVNGVPKLADIGLVASSSDARTFVGTEGFVPPEGPGTPAADVFALGKVLYELATGRDRAEFPNLPEELGDARERKALFALNDVLLRACDAAPAQRYRDGPALLADLEALQAGKPVRRLPRWLLGAAAMALAVLGAGTWWMIRKAPASIGQPKVAVPAAAPKTSGAVAKPAAAVSEKSLVVLPLENLSPDPADAFFTEGMHEEIIATLSRLGELKVLSRSTALTLKGTKDSLATTGQKLGVAYALSGSLQRRGKSVRIALELRRTADEGLVWHQPFNREFTDGFAVQDEITAEVAKVLQIHLSTGWFAGSKFMTKNAEAYELFLKARELPATKGPGRPTFLEQVALCERAVALDPEFMAGASLLSQAYSYLYTSSVGIIGAAERAEISAKAKRWGERASTLMPGGAGDGALSVYYSRVAVDMARSFVFAQNEVRALPNDPNAHNRVAVGLQGHGRNREALEAYNRALALDPFHARALYNRIRCAAYLRDIAAFEEAAAKSLEYGGRNVNRGEIDELRHRLTGQLPASLDHLKEMPIYMAQMLWLGRRFEQVLAFTEPLRGKDTTMRARFPLMVYRARAAQRLGRSEVAAEAARALMAIAETEAPAAGVNPQLQQTMMTEALTLGDRRAEALAAARRAVEAASTPAQTSLRWSAEVDLALIHAWFGNKTECVELVARLLKLPSGVTVAELRHGPDWDAVRDDPRFQALLADPKNSWPLGIDGPIPPAPATVSTVSVPGLISTPAPAPALPNEKAAAADKSLVVLPLENLSPDPENAYFTEGIHADIIVAVGRLSGVKVISRSAALHFKDSKESLAAIARALGVANVITGSVRRVGNQARIQLELRRASDEELLWSLPNSDRELKDVLGLQSEVATEVARVLRARQMSGFAASAKLYTSDPQAYDLFLKALKFYWAPENANAAGRNRSCELFSEVVQRDPKFVWAVYFLCTAHAESAEDEPDAAKRAAHVAEAKRWAETAAQLDSALGDAAMSYCLTRLDDDPVRGLELAQRAARLLPNDAIVHLVMGLALERLGRSQEAVEAYVRVNEIDPFERRAIFNRLFGLAALRRADEFEPLVERFLAVGGGAVPSFPGALATHRYRLRGEVPAEMKDFPPGARITFLMRARRWADARQDVELALANPKNGETLRCDLLRWRAETLRQLGLAKEADEATATALAAAEKLNAANPGPPAPQLIFARSVANRANEAIAAAQLYAQPRMGNDHVTARWAREQLLARILARAGRTRESVAIIKQQLALPSGLTVPMLRAELDWDNLRDDPAFQALLADPKNSAAL